MSSINSKSPLSCLPVELLEGVLSHLQTKELLRISTVSQKVYVSAYYLVRQRFRDLENLDGHHLIFECSPPSRRRTAYHTCHYSGVYPITKSAPYNPVQHRYTTSPSSLYSHFIPLPTGPGRFPPINTPPSFTCASQLVSRMITLDTSAYFTQLMASSVLAKRVGAITSVINIFPETFFRIRRSWLREAAKQGEREKEVLWLDDKGNVGLRLRVVEKGVMEETQSLTIQREGDEGATSFECMFEEFCVRTGYLVGKIEEAEERESESSGLQVVFMG